MSRQNEIEETEELRMPYDLDEEVQSGEIRKSLREAVAEFIQARDNLPHGHIMMPVMWNREIGKDPAFFEAKHMEELARLPEFAKR